MFHRWHTPHTSADGTNWGRLKKILGIEGLARTHSAHSAPRFSHIEAVHPVPEHCYDRKRFFRMGQAFAYEYTFPPRNVNRLTPVFPR